MTALRNPYLSNDYENSLMRKNYNVIKAPQTQALYTQYSSQGGKGNKYINYGNTNKNQESLTTVGNSSSMLSLKNPFANNNQQSNSPSFSYYHNNLPSFYTQPYLPSVQKRQLPFPSYNRAQSNRPLSSSSLGKPAFQLAMSRRNQAGSNAESIQKSLSPYRPHFMSPATSNNWNTQRWKRQLEKQQRQKLKKFGPQALRFENQTKQNFNNEYYSTNNLKSKQTKYISEIPKNTTKLTNQKKSKQKQQFQEDEELYNYKITKTYFDTKQNIFSIDSATDPDNFQRKNHNKMNERQRHEKREKQQNNNILHEQQSENENFQSRIEHYQSRGQSMGNDYEDKYNNRFKGIDDRNKNTYNNKSNLNNKMHDKYEKQQGIGIKKGKGPLNLDAFDSMVEEDSKDSNLMFDSNFNQFNSGKFNSGKFNSQKFETGKYRPPLKMQQSQVQQGFESKGSFGQNRNRKQMSKVVKDYPQKIDYKGQFFYRVRLINQNQEY